jgi:hypothetical protein
VCEGAPLSFWSSRQAFFDISIKRRILSDAESMGWIDPADLPMFIKGLSDAVELHTLRYVFKSTPRFLANHHGAAPLAMIQ